MKKRIMSIALVFALTLSAAPFIEFTDVSALSNAEVLTPIVYQTGKYIIVANSLNVRSGPSTSNSKVTAVAKDKTVTVSEIQDGWGKISVNGKTGWIDLSYAYSDENNVDIAARLDMLRVKFPDGTYWNREDANVNNADGYSTTPCADGHADKRENYFDGTCQCHGFALKLGYDLFGIHASSWVRHYDLTQVKAGDLIRYRARHTVMVTGVYDDYFTVADCNWNYHCGIDWDRTMKKSYISFTDDSYDGIYHCQANGKINVNSGSTVTPSTAPTSASTTKTTTTTKTTAAPTESFEGKLTVTGDVVNVRLSANASSLVIGKVKQGESYTYSNVKTVSREKWYFIKLGFLRMGWVNGNYVKVTQNGTTAATKATTTSKQTTTTTTKTTTTKAATTTTKAEVYTVGKLKVTGDVVNVRSGAGTNYKVVTKVKKNAEYTYTKEKTVQGKKWYYIKVSSSKSGWICSSYVKVTQKLGAEIPSVSSQKIKVTTNLLNVRASAGTNSKIVTQVKKNSVYTYTDKKTVKGVVWYKIKVSSSKTGWISGDYCKEV